MKSRHVIYALILLTCVVSPYSKATFTPPPPFFDITGLPIFGDVESVNRWCTTACEKENGDYTGRYRGIPYNTCTCQKKEIQPGGHFHVFGLPFMLSVTDVNNWCTSKCEEKGGTYENLYRGVPWNYCVCKKK